MPDLILTRTGSNAKHKTISGELEVKGKKFFTVERMGYAAFRTGRYAMEMSLKRTGRKIPCLRPVDCPLFTILIHDADNDKVTALEGCVGPGLERDPETGSIRKSAEAMKEILDLLGGWPDLSNPPKQFVLEVTNNPAGVTGDRESYWTQRVPYVKTKYGVSCPLEATPAPVEPPPPEPVPQRYRYLGISPHEDEMTNWLRPFMHGPF